MDIKLLNTMSHDEVIQLLKELKILNSKGNIIEENWRKIPAVDEGALGKIWGNDTRREITRNEYSIFPYNGVVKLLSFYNNRQMYRGTGFLIDRDKVVTAGHMLISRTNPQLPQRLVAFNDTGVNVNIGVIQTARLDPSRYFGNDLTFSTDWAVVRINRNLGINNNILPMFPNVTGNIINNLVGEIPGYPVVAQGRDTETLWTASGNLELNPNNAVLGRYRIPTSGGDSGAAVLATVGGSLCAVGIHVGGDDSYNYCRLIGRDVFDEIITF